VRGKFKYEWGKVKNKLIDGIWGSGFRGEKFISKKILTLL